jgi:hypothetical protein
MRLATFRDGSRDGRLSLVRSDGTWLAGDRVAMEVFDVQGRSVFGRIEQKVIPAG